MLIPDLNRRRFLFGMASAGVLAADLHLQASDEVRTLYNRNYQTAIGVGDEPLTFVDRFGQLQSDDANVPELANAARGGGSRNVTALLYVGNPHQPVSTFKASQRLDDGYLPVVLTNVRTGYGEFQSVAFSSIAGVKSDYLGILPGRNSFRVRLLCPTTTAAKIEGGVVRTPEKVLAIVPAPASAKISNARYSYLTPERNSRIFPSGVAWEGLPRVKSPQHLDSAFSHARTSQRSVEYSFPATTGATYHVFLGVGRPECLVGDPNYFKGIRLSVEGESRTYEFQQDPLNQPVLGEFVVTPSEPAIRVRSEGLNGGPLLSGIWIFEGAAEASRVSTGELNKRALYYVACGQERAEDIVTCIDLEYEASPQSTSTTWIQLPYSLRPGDLPNTVTVSPESALSAVKEHWRSFLDGGAQFLTGLPQLDNLYRTSLLNLFLLRTKHAAAGTGGQDIYVVKPGATIYDSFWFRDGAYIINAMDVAGHPEEAEKSSRLLTDGALKGPLKEWGQQADGLWASPRGEWDSQGQALWTLIHHYELTGDAEWLLRNYESIRRGALWIKDATAQTKKLDAGGKRPITWGLLPKGVSEDTGSSAETYVYEHDFWVAFGLREAIKAAERLDRHDDVRWMTEAYKEFSVDLLASVRRAYDTTGGGKYIPGDPFDPELDINGDLAAVYPGRFLDPKDPMMKSSLARIAQHSQEDLYTWFKTLNNGDMWTYMTVDWAMCSLLADDLSQFYKLYKSYVAHASPTNGWPECIYVESRLGTGDTPHGWAAASYVLLHRNAFAHENENYLELCWGVHPEWLVEGAHISVRQAPTRFGKVNLDLKRSGARLAFEYKLEPVAGQVKPREVRLHLPVSVLNEIRSIRMNGTDRRLSPDEPVIRIA